MLAGPISVQFVPSALGTACPWGQIKPQCMCSGPSPPLSPPVLPERCHHVAYPGAREEKKML